MNPQDTSFPLYNKITGSDPPPHVCEVWKPPRLGQEDKCAESLQRKFLKMNKC